MKQHCPLSFWWASRVPVVHVSAAHGGYIHIAPWWHSSVTTHHLSFSFLDSARLRKDIRKAVPDHIDMEDKDLIPSHIPNVPITTSTYNHTCVVPHISYVCLFVLKIIKSISKTFKFITKLWQVPASGLIGILKCVRWLGG